MFSMLFFISFISFICPSVNITASGAGRVSEWKRAGSYQKGPDLNKTYKVTQSITGLNEKKEKIKK